MKKRTTREVLWLTAPVLVLVGVASVNKPFQKPKTTLTVRSLYLGKGATSSEIELGVGSRLSSFSFFYGEEPRIARVDFFDENNKRLFSPTDENMIRSVRSDRGSNGVCLFSYSLSPRKIIGKGQILKIQHTLEAKGARPTIYSVTLKKGRDF